jgi:hypothetical protein
LGTGDAVARRCDGCRDGERVFKLEFGIGLEFRIEFGGGF